MQGLHTPPPKISGSSFFTPLIISMAGIVTTCIIIVTYHFVLVKCCRRRPENNISSTSRRPRRRRGGQGGSFGTQLPNGGVDKKILEALPLGSYFNNLEHSRSECVVCLGELEDGDKVRLLPSCRHVFHVSCIDEWFSNHTSCPICREPINSASVLDPTVDSSQLNDPLMMITEERKLNRLRLMTRLKRSLSMDQSYVVFNREEGQTNGGTIYPCSSSSSSSKNEATSVRQLDRVSSMLVRSVSLLRMSRNSNAILPY